MRNILIQGKILDNAIAVPRDAIREGNRIWLVNDDRLRIQPLEIVRADKDFAYVVSGVPDKANVVTSSLDVAIEGMDVRTEVDIRTDNERIGQHSGQSGNPEEN